MTKLPALLPFGSASLGPLVSLARLASLASLTRPVRPVRFAWLTLFALGAILHRPAAAESTNAPAVAPRVEARSPQLVAVGIVRGNRMTIHVSRSLDNVPVRDAVVNVILRGSVHPTIADADGGYSLESQDLTIAGSAAVIFRVISGGTPQELKGTLEITAANGKQGDKNSARQLGWWVLNFAVCIGFLMLISRRRKVTAAQNRS